MVIMKGTSRIFDKPLEEQEGSTSGLKVLSIYGVKSYNELINIPIEIRCSSIVGTQTNININSLGSKNLVFQGSTTLPDAWTSTGLIYRIMYNGSNFQLLSYSSGGSSSNSDIFIVPSAILSLTNESTSEEINEIFDGGPNIPLFIEAIINNKLIILGGTSVITSLETSSIDNEDGTTITETIKLLMTDFKQLRTIKLTRDKTITNAYTSVVVTNEDLGNSTNIFIIPKAVLSLTSESTNDEIIEAFGGEEIIQSYINAIKDSSFIIKIEGTTTVNTTTNLNKYYIAVSQLFEEQRTDVESTGDTLHYTVKYIDENNSTVSIILKQASGSIQPYSIEIITEPSLTSDGSVTKIIKISQADYDALTTKESTTFYIIE